MRTKKVIDLLSLEEVEALIGACGRRSPTGLRNRAMIAVLYGGALRVSEALSLEPKDLDLAKRTGRVVGKGGKAREFGLAPMAVPHVELWLATRAKLGLARGRGRRLFCTLDGGPMSDRYVRALLARKAEAIGSPKRVHPHALRHSMAAELDERGARVTDIAAQLGHGSVATTQGYLRTLRAGERLDRIVSVMP